MKHKYTIGMRVSFCLNEEDDFWTNGYIITRIIKNNQPYYEVIDTFRIGYFLKEVAEVDMKESF